MNDSEPSTAGPDNDLIDSLAMRVALGESDCAASLIHECRHILHTCGRSNIVGLEREDLFAMLKASLVIEAPRAWEKAGFDGHFGAFATVILRRRWLDAMGRSRRQAALRQLILHVSDDDPSEPRDRQLTVTTTPLDEVIEREEVQLAAEELFDAAYPRTNFPSTLRQVAPLLALGLSRDEAAEMVNKTGQSIGRHIRTLRERTDNPGEIRRAVAVLRDGVEIGRYKTIAAACEATGVSQPSASEMLAGRRRTAKGFVFQPIRGAEA